MEIEAEFYEWVKDDDTIPEWVKKAFDDGTIVGDGDGDAFLVTLAGRTRIDPGACLMHSMGTIFLMDAAIYGAMMEQRSVKPPPLDLDEPDGLGEPPYSSSVLARSARARMRQAMWEKNADPDNARIEGEDTVEKESR
jgi:hypothetical protein